MRVSTVVFCAVVAWAKVAPCQAAPALRVVSQATVRHSDGSHSVELTISTVKNAKYPHVWSRSLSFPGTISNSPYEGSDNHDHILATPGDTMLAINIIADAPGYTGRGRSIGPPPRLQIIFILSTDHGPRVIPDFTAKVERAISTRRAARQFNGSFPPMPMTAQMY